MPNVFDQFDEGKGYLPIDPNRPVVVDESGRHTELSASFWDDDLQKEVLIRTVVDGQILDTHEAWKRWTAGTNPEIGMFDSAEEATAFSKQRSAKINPYSGNKGPAANATFIADSANVFDQFDQPRTATDQLGRQAGLTARAVVGGAAKTFTGINDAVNMAVNHVLDKMGVDYRQEMTSPMVDEALTAIGLPEPETPTERVVNTAGEFISGGAVPVGMGVKMAGGTSQAVRGVGDVLQANRGTQGASALAGGTTLGAAQEADLPPAAQQGLSLAASTIPGMGPGAVQSGLRGLFRGRDPAQMQENIRTFEAAGASPSVGQATQNRRTQTAESFLSKVPGGAGRMAKVAEQQNRDIGEFVDSTVSRLVRNTDMERAGLEVERGIKGVGGFVDRFRLKAKGLYDQVDRFIRPDQPIELTATRKIFSTPDEMAQHAPNTTRKIGSKFFDDLGIALEDDVEAFIAQNGFEGLPYAAVKQIRTAVGERLNNISLVDDVSKGQLKQLYGALSDDLTTAAHRNGPQAAAAAKRANSYWRAGRGRIDLIERVVNKVGGTEKIFKSLMSGTQDGATMLRTVMKSLRPEERDWVTATVVRRLGTATPGQQNAAGDRFNLNTYLTNWNRLSPQAKSVLFSGKNADTRRATDHVAKVAENVKEGSKVFANPSGTQPAISLQTTGVGGAVALATGNLSVAGWIAALPISANLGARLMTNRTVVNWLAKTTQIPRGAIPAAMNELVQMTAHSKDEDLVELLGLLEEQ